MTICNKPSFVATIVFHIENKMDPKWLVSWGNLVSIVAKRGVIIQLLRLECNGISPSCVLILTIKLLCFLQVLGDLKTMLALGCGIVGSKLGLVHHSNNFFCTFGKAFEAFPAIQIKEVVVLGSDCTANRGISSNVIEWFAGNLPIFPFNHDVVLGSFVVRVIGSKGALVCRDLLELPKAIWIVVFGLIDVLDNVVAGEHILKSVIIYRHSEFELRTFQLVVKIFNLFNNASTKTLAIRLRWKQETASNEVGRQKLDRRSVNGRVGQTGSLIGG